MTTFTPSLKASFYDSTMLYREVADRLLAHLDLMRIQPKRILDLSAGTDYVSELLKKCYPYAEVCNGEGGCEVEANPMSLSPFPSPLTKIVPGEGGCFDLIIANLAFSSSEKQSSIFIDIQNRLNPNGLLLFSTFGPDTLGELRASWATVDDMPHVHIFLDLHDIGDTLIQAGFSDPVMQTEWLTLRYRHIKTLWDDLKNSGAVNTLSDRRKTLTGKQRFQQFLAEYETYRDRQQKLPATFEIIYGHAWKFQKSERKDEVRIPVSEIIRKKSI